MKTIYRIWYGKKREWMILDETENQVVIAVGDGNMTNIIDAVTGINMSSCPHMRMVQFLDALRIGAGMSRN